MGRQNIKAIEVLVRTLHGDLHEEFACNASDDDAIDDHDGELALAGQIIMDLRANGLIIAQKRQTRPRYGLGRTLIDPAYAAGYRDGSAEGGPDAP